MKVSHNVSKPRREAPAQGAAKAAEAHAHATSSKSKKVPQGRKTKACCKRSRCEVDVVHHYRLLVISMRPNLGLRHRHPAINHLDPSSLPCQALLIIHGPNILLNVHPHVRLSRPCCSTDQINSFKNTCGGHRQQMFSMVKHISWD
jgi:hypothetical protein